MNKIQTTFCVNERFERRKVSTLKEITSQTDQHLISLSSKTYVFEDKMIKYQSARPASSFCVCCSKRKQYGKEVRMLPVEAP